MIQKAAPRGLKDANDSTGDVVAIMNSGAWDRTGERIDPKGWVLEQFNKSGVITLNHAREGWNDTYHGLPIAVRREAWVEDAGLLVHYQYLLDAPGKLGELANAVYYLEKVGALAGHSVWFEPFAWTEPDGAMGTREWGDPYPAQMPRKGRVYTKTGLMEAGPVLIPAEPGSVTVAVKAFEERGLAVPDWTRTPLVASAEEWRSMFSDGAQRSATEQQPIVTQPCGCRYTTTGVLVEHCTPASMDTGNDPALRSLHDVLQATSERLAARGLLRRA